MRFTAPRRIIHHYLRHPSGRRDRLGTMCRIVRWQVGSRLLQQACAMRRADRFVLPTLKYARALAILEVMASGLPVVTTTNNGSGESIEYGSEGWIVPPGDAMASADALRRLVEQPHLRHRIGRAARAKVQGAHSWDTYGQSVLTAIHALDKNRRSQQEVRVDQ